MCTPCVKVSSSNKTRSEQLSVAAPLYTWVLEVCRSNLGPATDDPEIFRNFLQLLQATGEIMPDYATTASFSILSKSYTSHQSTRHLYVRRPLVLYNVFNHHQHNHLFFWISNFRHVLNVLCFLLGNSPASGFYMPTFRNTLIHLHGQVGMNNESLFTHTCLWRRDRQNVPKRRHIKIQTPGNYPKKQRRNM